MRARGLWLALWTAGGVTAIVALFLALDASPAALVATLAAAPPAMYAAAVATTLANQFVGAWKWRMAARWLAPERQVPSVGRMVELTALGAFFGQVAPPQVAASAVRGLAMRRETGAGGWAVGSTIFEQVFDLIVLVVAGALGLAMFVLAPSATVGAAVALLALALTMAGLRVVLGLAGALARRLGRVALAEAFGRARAAPPGVALGLLGWSAVRLGLVAARAVAVALVFAPGAAPLLVAAGYPAAGLAMALPLAPAGLGLAEWTWSGLLILAGAAPAAAAAAALAFRLVNLVALGVILLGLGVWRLVRPLRPTARAAAARPHL